MNTKLTVRLIADSNFIPVKYGVVEMNVGADTANTFCVLQVIRVGWNTETNYNNWKSTKTYDTASGTTTLVGRNPTGMQGTLGALSVVALNLITEYDAKTPSTDS